MASSLQDVQQERVSGIQSRIAEVRARLQTLHRTVDGHASAAQQHMSAADSMQAATPLSFSLNRVATSAAPVVPTLSSFGSSSGTTMSVSPPRMAIPIPLPAQSMHHQQQPTAGGSGLAPTSQPPPVAPLVGGVSTAPIMSTFPDVIDEQSRKLDLQAREIQFLRERLEETRNAILTNGDQQRSQQAPFPPPPVPLQTAPMPLPMRQSTTPFHPPAPSTVQVQLSPGVTMLSAAAEPAVAHPTSMSFNDMQAMLRQKMQERQQQQPTLNPLSVMPMELPMSSSQMVSFPGPSSMSGVRTAWQQRAYPIGGDSAAASPPLPSSARSGADGRLGGWVEAHPREGRAVAVSLSPMLNDAAEKAPDVRRTAAVPSDVEEKSIRKPQSPDVTVHTIAVSGAELFAILRLRGLIRSEGQTGEHLLPTTPCHTLDLTHSEYTQLVRLRELIGSKSQQQAAAASSIDSSHATRLPSRSRSPPAARPLHSVTGTMPNSAHAHAVPSTSAFGRRQTSSPTSSITNHVRATTPELSAFEKHRQRLESGRSTPSATARR